MSLPAGAMISLVVALEGRCTLWPRDGAPREVPAIDFVTGNHANVLRPGELLRKIHLPASALMKRAALRQASLTKLGRSAALLIGTSDPARQDLLLTITAATPRPVQLRFAETPSAEALRQAIDARIPADGYFADVHGSAAYKRHLTYHFAEQIRAELARPGASGMNDIARLDRPAPPARSPSASITAGSRPGRNRASACALFCASTAASASRRAAMPAIAAPAPSGSTERRCIPA